MLKSGQKKEDLNQITPLKGNSKKKNFGELKNKIIKSLEEAKTTESKETGSISSSEKNETPEIKTKPYKDIDETVAVRLVYDEKENMKKDLK